MPTLAPPSNKPWFADAIDAMTDYRLFHPETMVFDFTTAFSQAVAGFEANEDPPPLQGPFRLRPNVLVAAQLNNSGDKWLIDNITHERHACPEILLELMSELAPERPDALPSVTHVIESRYYQMEDELPVCMAMGVIWLGQDGHILFAAVLPPHPGHPTGAKWRDDEWLEQFHGATWVISTALGLLRDSPQANDIPFPPPALQA